MRLKRGRLYSLCMYELNKQLFPFLSSSFLCISWKFIPSKHIVLVMYSNLNYVVGTFFEFKLRWEYIRLRALLMNQTSPLKLIMDSVYWSRTAM